MLYFLLMLDLCARVDKYGFGFFKCTNLFLQMYSTYFIPIDSKRSYTTNFTAYVTLFGRKAGIVPCDPKVIYYATPDRNRCRHQHRFVKTIPCLELMRCIHRKD